MGIHLCWDRIGSSSSISKEDKSIRDKLFWSAFCWDKTISLSFGREPAFPPQSGQSPNAIPEFVDDDAIWQPYYAMNVHRPPSLTMYSFEPQSIVVTFRHHALLCLIVHDLITEIYGAGSAIQQAALDSFPKIEKALATWWERLPPAIRFEPVEPTGICPPPYIIAVKCAYLRRKT
ncbi:hypothetical protein BCR39DRAFT_180779 [Naematelia encephala]|uniref:Xylanolytic transcriptional activator regulatory domain-containing protein n=1 Tax=Naematelia encephala TaxID=71784 RepID=A0A1Y2B2H8_9TREE|nr:hypothetical protein BCR39DRAFT_180779 [Naematelia encephala]